MQKIWELCPEVNIQCSRALEEVEFSTSARLQCQDHILVWEDGTWGMGCWLLGQCAWKFQIPCRNEPLLPVKIKWPVLCKRSGIQPPSNSPLSLLKIYPTNPLITRSITKVKSQHNMAGEVLGLLKEKRDYTPKETQDLAKICQQELGECTWDWILKVWGQGQGETQRRIRRRSPMKKDLTPWQEP